MSRFNIDDFIVCRSNFESNQYVVGEIYQVAYRSGSYIVYAAPRSRSNCYFGASIPCFCVDFRKATPEEILKEKLLGNFYGRQKVR